MSNAIGLVIGGEGYMQDARRIERYLTQKVGMDVLFVRSGQNDHAPILDSLCEVIEAAHQLKNRRNTPPIVIWYIGHGEKGIMAGVPYSELASMVQESLPENGQFLFVNDTCFAGAAIDRFSQYNLSGKHDISLVCSSDREDLSWPPVFTNAYLHALNGHQNFERKRVGHNEKSKLHLRVTLDLGDPLEAKDIVVFRSVTSGEERRYRVARVDLTEKDADELQRVQHPQRYGVNLDHILFPR